MSEKLKNLQEEFLDNKFWVLTFGGAFQRANVYETSATENERTEFRNKLKKEVKALVAANYKVVVSAEMHIQNIKNLSAATVEMCNKLQNGQINFGVAQKLLNLYLKYSWCAGKIPTPPHFPVDRMIQEISKYKHVFAWTQMTDDSDYLKFLNFAESQLQDNESLAEWELKTFKRRVG